MARGLESALKTYLANQSQVKAGLVEIETSTGTVYYTDASFDITYDSNTYQAQGNFISVTEVEENAELVITNCILAISALDTANITKFATSDNVNKSVTVRVAYINPTDNSIVGTPIITFKGKITGYTVTDARNTATIGLEIASTFANFEKTTGRRTNEGSFQREHPSDRSMEFAHQTVQDILWGKT
jgi:hypothetical protein